MRYMKVFLSTCRHVNNVVDVVEDTNQRQRVVTVWMPDHTPSCYIASPFHRKSCPTRTYPVQGTGRWQKDAITFVHKK